MASCIITLTTDFGLRDGFVAAMKGVILSVCPDARLVDISHEIPAQNIPHAAFVIGTTCPYFPAGTIHVAVVDPGVGTARHPLLLVTPRDSFIAPDNGILSYVLLANGAQTPLIISDADERDTFMKPMRVSVPASCAAYMLNRDDYWLKPVSATFHGRDIFAPVAARLASGVAPVALGEPLNEVVCLDIPGSAVQGSVARGRVIYVDHFGNLISNIRLGDVVGKSVEVEIQGRHILGLSWSYASAAGLLAIVGSHGYLEIAVRKGSAAHMLDAKVGSRVKVTIAE